MAVGGYTSAYFVRQAWLALLGAFLRRLARV